MMSLFVNMCVCVCDCIILLVCGCVCSLAVCNGRPASIYCRMIEHNRYKMISLLPLSLGHITKLLYSIKSDEASMVAVWMFCFPFNVSVHRMMVCCISELKSTAGHTTSAAPCHNCFLSSGSFVWVKLFRTLDEAIDDTSSEMISLALFTSILTLMADSDLEND